MHFISNENSISINSLEFKLTEYHSNSNSNSNDLKSISNRIHFSYCFLICLVLDAWGKIPAAVLSGNTYDLGGFAQCFELDRDAESFETQYCLGRLFFDVQGNIMPKQYRYNLNNIMFPDMTSVDDLPM